MAAAPARRYRFPVAADRGERPRDERGRFLPNEEAAKPKRARASKAGAKKPATSRTAKARSGPKRGGAQRRPHASPSSPSSAVVEESAPPIHSAPADSPAVDAMGLDKRRGVVGGRYSPSRAKQATLYGAFIAIVAVLGIGFILLTNELDQPPSSYSDEAAWSAPDAEQVPPRPLDFPRSGSPDVAGAGP